MNSPLLKVGIVMDPIKNIKPYKDSSFAMLLEAQRRGHSLFYMQPEDLSLKNGQAWAEMSELKVWDKPASEQYYGFGQSLECPVSELDIILIRQDPPFNSEYLYSTHILEQAETEGVLVVNKPQSLRDANEKLFASWFPQCIPETLVSAKPEAIKTFIQTHQDTVKANDPNINVILETMTQFGQTHIMAQVYLPAIKQGDKRILLINGGQRRNTRQYCSGWYRYWTTHYRKRAMALPTNCPHAKSQRVTFCWLRCDWRLYHRN